MVEIINSSFIPKSEFSSKNDNDQKRGSGVNVFFLIALVIFLSTVIGSVWVWTWKESLISSNRQSKENFAENRENYGIETIKKFSDLNTRIDVGKKLLSNHYNVLPILVFLEKHTQSNIILNEFSLEEMEDKIFIKSSGIAPTLEDLYLQSRSYLENKNIEDFILSNISRNNDKLVVFNLEFTVDKKNLTQREFIN